MHDALRCETQLQDNIIHSETRCKCFTNHCNIITARKRTLRRLCFHRCMSVHRGVSVSVWGSLSGGVSVQGDLCSGGSLSRGVSVQGDLCSGGSLSRSASVQGRESLSRGGGLCPGGLWGISVQGGLCLGVSVRGVSVMETPMR